MKLLKKIVVISFLLTINIALSLNVNASDTLDLVAPEGDLLENESVIESSTDSSTIDIIESSSSEDHILESSLNE